MSTNLQLEDVTKHLISALHVWRSKLSSAPPATAPLPKTLTAALEALDGQTMGYISNTLTYSRVVYGAQERKNLVRLLKGGFLRVVLVNQPAPETCKDCRPGFAYGCHYRIERVAA